MGIFSGSKTTTTTDVLVEVTSDPTINIDVDIGSLASAFKENSESLQGSLKSGVSNIAMAVVLAAGLVGLGVKYGLK